MFPEFQLPYWEERFRMPDWYSQFEPELTRFLFTVVHDDPQLKVWRHRIYGLLEEMLERGEVPLAANGPYLDARRQKPDTLVIHHTEQDPAMPLTRLSAIGLLRQYGQQYLKNDLLGWPVRGQPVWSGHFRAGQMVFFAYHWLIYPDGTRVRLLEDCAIGWHAGDWEINTRSIGLALAGNYEHATPPAAQLAAVADFMQTEYPDIPRSRVFGHREIRPELTCPGDRFLGGWQAQLFP